MHKRVAYVVASSIDPQTAYLVETGRLPRFEYNLFLSRNDADLIEMRHIAGARSLAAKAWKRLDKPMFALAALVHERAIKYDAIVASGEDIGIPIALGAMFDALTVPIHIITHGSYFGSHKFAKAASLLRRMHSVHFHCISESLCTELVDQFGISAENAHATGYGIDTEFFKPQPSDDAPVVVSAGTANRDYRTLVSATMDIDAQVKIAADSAWFPTKIDIAADALPSNIEARSYGDYCGLRDLYARASVVVVPLYPAHHACGYAVVGEAMAMGKPVIVTRTAALSDFVIDGETGFYVDPGDVEGLRSQIAELLESPRRAEAMGRAGRARIASLFSVEDYCDRLEEAVVGDKNAD